MTPAQRHMGRVKAIPCVLCSLLVQHQEAPTEAHHLREGLGTGQRASDWLTIALCPDCHRGPHGIHGDRRLLKIAKVSELQLLALTIEEVVRSMAA